jgi:hypothetical protein
MNIAESKSEFFARIHADRCETAYEILQDLVELDSEAWAIGGGPGFNERKEAVMKRARELFEP